MKVDLADDDPRAVRIRSFLFGQGSSDQMASLWQAARTEHRNVLVALAASGEMSQSELEIAVGVSAVQLRGLHGGLAKIAKRLGVAYPIRSAGTKRLTRRFSMENAIAKQLLKISRTNNR